MAFYHLVTNEELDQSVTVNFTSTHVTMSIERKLAERLELAPGGRVMLMLDNDQSPNLLKVWKDEGTSGWEVLDGSDENAPLVVKVRQLATTKCKGEKKLDAIINNEGQLVVTLPKTFLIADEDMVRKARKKAEKSQPAVGSRPAPKLAAAE